MRNLKMVYKKGQPPAPTEEGWGRGLRQYGVCANYFTMTLRTVPFWLRTMFSPRWRCCNCCPAAL